ncbi:MAG: TIGR00282 family metallophosphoesterase [Acidobacteriota bacterium]
MRILFAGDVVGRAGRQILRRALAHLQALTNYELVVANVENAAGGFGVTPEVADKLFAMGIDVLTSGNHIWDKKEVMDYLVREPRLLRPVNYPPSCPGSGSYVARTASGKPVAVLNLQGRVFMPITDCPFQAAEREVARLKKEARVILVDAHCEATSEKMALAWFLDGKVSAVVGTHTHVPTADERVFPGGTAYITDIGMCGPFDSVIGIEKDASLSRFLTSIPSKFETAKENPWMNAVEIDVDESTGLARSIKRVRVVESDLGE